MELHSPNGELLVSDAHNFAFLGFRGDFQAFRQRLALDHQRMVTRRRKRIGHGFKQILSVMFNERSLTVHHTVIHHDVPAKNMSNTLMSQTNAERRDLRTESADNFIG